ncbi:TonB-dependent receptor domain-containing protein [Pararhodobacter zhoushanensis]|uniref:TonB-dependent receptor n=1 Tax=Pararhodobacter zhoushanensis TaxID=2479545 RepID=A0ABT3GV61_9RHOB|nr:TonB-dependent receptor [Pararhodobacter zhoushanensis]MCW1931429.1 TonB-dependent receptor [Pararhodobacter zhoushanensis]
MSQHRRSTPDQSPRLEGRLQRLTLRASCGVLALGAALPTGLSAQATNGDVPVDLGRIVVTAAGFEQAIADAPASITVISREDLETGAYRDLTDALREVQGLVTTGIANEQDIQIRGLPGGYTLMLIDGRRVSTRESRPNGDSGFEQRHFPPLNMIERIEVVRGPMSSLYGADAMGGVVNVITRPVASTWSGSVTTEGTVQEHNQFGNSAALSFEASGPLIADRLGVQIWGRLYRRSEDTLIGGIEEAEDSSLGVRFSFTPTDDHEFTLEAGRSRLGSTATAGGTIAAGSNGSHRENDRDYLVLGHTGHFGAAETQLTFQHEEAARYTYADPAATPGWVLDERIPRLANTTLDGQVTLPWALGGEHRTVMGFQYSRAQLTDRGYAATDQDMQVEQWALFAEDEWRLSDSFALTGGLRYDHHSIYGGQVSPRLYAVWHATEALTIKGGVSTGFTAPAIRLIAPGYYYPTQRGAGVIAPNPDLQPETSTSFELGGIWERGGLSFSATGFYTDFRSKISNMNTGMLVNPDTGAIIDPLGGAACNATEIAAYPGYRCLWQAFNIDDAVVQGVELASSWQIDETWALRGSYTFTDSEQRTGDYAGFPLQRTPRHRATLRVDWAPMDSALSLWAAATYHGEEIAAGARIGTNGRPVLINGVAGRAYDPYTTVDLGGSYALTDAVTMNAAVYNLFDEVVEATDSNTVGEGRRFWLGLTARF